MSEQPPAPVLRVVRGRPTPEEVAAVVAVVAAAYGGGQAPPPRTSRSLWAAPSYAATRLPRPGPGAWRASALPR